MQTIQATVNPRLLTKADRLFTGTLQGRIIEILQNARRAGAMKVEITNRDGFVTVQDNGVGIEDFSKLLDLGGSGWEDRFEQSEDPAGVGIFCLAPRAVTIRSNGKMVTIRENGWIGDPVAIRDVPESIEGTILQFQDEAWDSQEVDTCAVFSSMQVIVDGQTCPQLSFVTDQTAAYPELGCRIEVCQSGHLNKWHRACRRSYGYCDNVFVNFHGQVVSLDCHPVSEHHLCFMVDLTGEPTGIRLMLPARTQLVQNEVFDQLKAAMELEAYRYLQKRGRHRLPYKQYKRAKELCIDLPEADPVCQVGLLTGDTPEPVEVALPKGFPLAKCYRFDPDFKGGAETDEANVHLLAALGMFTEPFVPVSIEKNYDGYSWANLSTIGKVKVKAGKTLLESWIWSGKLACVDSLIIECHTSDGRVWKSPVCMSMRTRPEDSERSWYDEEALVTPKAQVELNTTNIWYHLGGWSDEGDTYDTQLACFEEDLDRFWAQLIGPDEQFRQTICGTLDGFKPDWKSVTVLPDGQVIMKFKDGSKKTIKPPKSVK